MSKVKGLMISPWVNMITDENREEFNKWLDDEDKELLSQTFFPSSWYPFSIYQHIVDAASAVIANNDTKILTNWGYLYAQRMMTGTYRNMFVPNDPIKSLEKNSYVESLFFDFGKVEIKVTGENVIEIYLHEFPREFRNLYWVKNGWYVGILEMTGAKNIESHFIAKSWSGDPITIIEYRFS